MKTKKLVLLIASFFILIMALAPVICLATQVTPTFKWSPAKPEEVIKQYFNAQCRRDYSTIKSLMVYKSTEYKYPTGEFVSLIGWQDYFTSDLFLDNYINKVKTIRIVKLYNYSDAKQNMECYEVTGDFEFALHAPFNSGPKTYYVYLHKDENDVWKLYAPLIFEWGIMTRVQQEYPEVQYP